MEKNIVVTGKTIDLAIESALSQLGLDRDSVSVLVLQQAKQGFLGFGAQPAKVQVTYEAPDPVPEAPKTALSSASRSKPKAAAPVKRPEAPQPEKKPEMPKAEPKAEPKPEAPKAPKAERKPEPPKAPKAERKPEAPKAEPKAEKKPREYVPAEPGSVEEKIETFVKGLLEHMDSKAVPHCFKEESGSYKVDLVGDDLGYLIGRRGDTLDAIQHLTNYAVNRDVEGRIRVNVDAEAYREKREDSLRRYARKKAQQVLKARRRTTLEPMNAYERHVIHAALQDMENITTHSTGVEPNRRVVIEYVR
ncbi:MAG: RNA-binding cell elongation regulator Jag/EloR [Candidatus Faecousia sp.]|nr:RNA-binding cell elongation regulator Jag/EloR [Candidatus Faecousia sp.]